MCLHHIHRTPKNRERMRIYTHIQHTPVQKKHQTFSMQCVGCCFYLGSAENEKYREKAKKTTHTSQRKCVKYSFMQSLESTV